MKKLPFAGVITIRRQPDFFEQPKQIDEMPKTNFPTSQSLIHLIENPVALALAAAILA